MTGHVALFALGGTIAMTPAPGGGVIAGLTGDDLLATAGDLQIEVRSVRSEPVASAGLSFTDVLDVVAAAGREVEAGAAGVVLTQGTDTMEEVAFLVDSVWPHDAPFVITGAMRNPTQPGDDGPANLRAAVQVAGADACRGQGALLVFADEIHAARHVRKTHATAIDTFVSSDLGPIGYVAEDEARLLARVPRRDPVLTGDPARVDAVQVALWTTVLDDDGAVLDGLARTHQGLVVAGFGAGHIPPVHVPALTEVARAMPVVLCSRAGAGPVLAGTYASPGSERDLLDRGLVGGGLVHPYKARVLLRLLVAAGVERAGIDAAFRALS